MAQNNLINRLVRSKERLEANGATVAVPRALVKGVRVAAGGQITAWGEALTQAHRVALVVTARSQSKPGHTHRAALVKETFYTPHGDGKWPTYHIGLLALAAAVRAAWYEGKKAPDAAKAVVEAYVGYLRNRNDGNLARAVVALGDWLRSWPLADHLATEETSRLGHLQGVQDFPASLFTDPGELRQLLEGDGRRAGRATPGGMEATAFPAGEEATEPAEEKPKSQEQPTFIGWQLAALKKALRADLPALLIGPTGTGKTRCVLEAFRALGLPFEVVVGKEGLLDVDFLGAIVPREGGSREWVDGPLARAVRRANREGKVALFVDELTRLPTHQANILVDLLNPLGGDDIRRMGGLVEVESPSDRYYAVEIPAIGELLVVPVERLVVVAAANVGLQYTGAYGEMDPALLRRFAVELEFDYPDPTSEVEILAREAGVDEAVAEAMVQVAQEVRRLEADLQVPGSLDTGTLVSWAKVYQTCTDSGKNVGMRLLVSARITWVNRVAGRDPKGRPIAENVARLEQAVAAAVGKGVAK